MTEERGLSFPEFEGSDLQIPVYGLPLLYTAPTVLRHWANLHDLNFCPPPHNGPGGGIHVSGGGSLSLLHLSGELVSNNPVKH